MNVLLLVVGAIIPMYKLFNESTSGIEPNAFVLGALGGAALLGLVIGAPIFGRIGDRIGYLWPFRISALLILIGGLSGWLINGPVWCMIASLFVVGLGIGGGYSLDQVYLSELMPQKYSLKLIGLAKTIAAFGACWGGILVFEIVKAFPEIKYWRFAMMIMAFLGLASVIFRIKWWESPKWLILHNRQKEAEIAAKKFYGPHAVPAKPEETSVKPLKLSQLLKGKSLWKVIATSIPWALDGISAYGMGNFMPLILMQLGFHLGNQNASGVPAVEHSLLLSSAINLFIMIGFALGLIIMDRIYHIRLMASGFAVATIGVLLVIATHSCSWNIWIGLLAFMIFEAGLSAGPGLITFVLPSEVYTPEERGTGAGLSASIGKIGALVGVFIMPSLMNRFGSTGVLIFCAAALVLGLMVTAIAGPKALPKPAKHPPLK